MMKSINFFFGLLLLFLVNAAHSQSAAVTFQVDMNNETVSADGVHIAGGFQGWDPATTLMSDDDLDGVYEVTIELPTDSTYEFKFINGMAWDFVEDVPPTCQVEVGGNDNRFVTVGADETEVTYHICWGSCAACGLTTVRFRVDMSEEAAISPNGVHVAGNFQGWAPSGSPMSDADGDGVWESWASFDPLDITDGALLFKFINGNSWANPNENLTGEACADAFGNRMLSMTSENMVLIGDSATNAAPCFNSCGSCVSPTQVTFRVDVRTQETVSVNGIHVAGSFQGWSPSTNPLSDDDGDGIWEGAFEIAPGEIQFLFINGNNWGGSGAGNVDNEQIVGDCAAEGSFNRALTVSNEATVYEVCYNSCLSECSAGCTDDWACNFAPTAQYDDGSCDYASCINCSADYDFGNEDWAYAPDPENSEGFESAFLNEFYQDEFHIVVPSNASAIDPAFQLPLDYLLLVNAYATASDGTIFELDDLGLNVSCDFSNSGENVGCYFPASSQSCVTLAGVPSLEGTYWITFAMEAYVTVFGVSVAQPLVLGGIPLTIAANFCTDPIACNYNPNALEDDGSCEYESCAGCMDESACNFNPGATIPDPNSCTYPEPNQDCGGYCIDPTACNYVEDPPTGEGITFYSQSFEDFSPGDYISDDSNWITWNAGQEGTDQDAQISTIQAFTGENSLHIYANSAAGGPLDVVMLVGLDEGVYTASWMMYVTDGNSAYYNIQEDLSPGVGWAFDVTFAFTGDLQVVMDGATVGSGVFPIEEWFEVRHDLDLENDLITLTIAGNVVGSFTFDSPFGGVNFFGYGDGTTVGNWFMDDMEIHDGTEGEDPESCTYPGCQDPEASNYDATAGCAGECVYLTYDCSSIGDEAWTAEGIGLFPDWQQAMHGVEWAGEWVLNIPATIVEPGSGVVYGIHHMDWTGLEGLPDWVESASYELGELDASTQHCIAASGTPAAPGLHEMTATGEVFISIFGQPFSIGEQSFSAWLEVAENPNPIPGCTYANAVNFVSYANDDDGSCLFAGCTDSTAANFNPIATIDDGSCGEACDPAGDSTCQADNDGDGVITVTDLLILLGEFGATCE